MCFTEFEIPATEPIPSDLLEQMEMLKSILVARATGEGRHSDERRYSDLRRLLMADELVWDALPRFVRTHRTLSEFWGYIKGISPTYQGRRDHLREQFHPALSVVEERRTGNIVSCKETLAKFDSPHIARAWDKCIERVESDPEGAVTAARALLESVCKHILVESGSKDAEGIHELPKLYDATSQVLKLAPSLHTVDAFKRILGGCTTVVNSLASIRNSLSDAHGFMPGSIRPAPRHARLAVNCAGTMAMFLVETFEYRASQTSNNTPA